MKDFKNYINESMFDEEDIEKDVRHADLDNTLKGLREYVSKWSSYYHSHIHNQKSIKMHKNIEVLDCIIDNHICSFLSYLYLPINKDTIPYFKKLKDAGIDTIEAIVIQVEQVVDMPIKNLKCRALNINATELHDVNVEMLVGHTEYLNMNASEVVTLHSNYTKVHNYSPMEEWKMKNVSIKWKEFRESMIDERIRTSATKIEFDNVVIENCQGFTVYNVSIFDDSKIKYDVLFDGTSPVFIYDNNKKESLPFMLNTCKKVVAKANNPKRYDMSAFNEDNVNSHFSVVKDLFGSNVKIKGMNEFMVRNNNVSLSLHSPKIPKQAISSRGRLATETPVELPGDKNYVLSIIKSK